MSSWKTLLLNVYYYGSYPHRAWRIAQRAGGRSPVMVLFYHRIADDRATPWTTSNLTFGRQMRWLKRHFDMVSLAEAQRRLKSGERSALRGHYVRRRLRRQLPFCAAAIGRTENPLHVLCFHASNPGGRRVSARCRAGRPLAPNTPEEICRMAAAGIEIGAHSRTHADLGPTIDRAHCTTNSWSRQELQDLHWQSGRLFRVPLMARMPT